MFFKFHRFWCCAECFDLRAVAFGFQVESMTSSYCQLPGTLLANIPGILGFYPHDSVVFAVFTHPELSEDVDGEAGTSFDLGPVLRIDISRLRYLPDLGASIDELNPAYVFAFIISDRDKDPDFVDQAYLLLAQAADAQIVHIDACWHTNDIMSGNPYHLWFQREPRGAVDHTQRVFPPVDPQGVWMKGSIPSVAQAVSTQSLLKQGFLPELSRDDCVAYFDAHVEPESPTHWRRRDAVIQKSSAMLFDAENDVETLTPHFARLHAVIDTLDHDPDYTLTEAELEFVGAILARLALRDAFLQTLTSKAQPCLNLALQVARAHRDQVRCNALCVYALTDAMHLASPRVFHALIASQEENPEHRLTQLLLTGYQHGKLHLAVAAVTKGSEATLNNFGKRAA